MYAYMQCWLALLRVDLYMQ